MTMVEIGSYRGESAQEFLNTGRIARIYCVDPWRMFYDADDGTSYTDMAQVERDFDWRHGGDSRVVKVKGTVDTFIKRHPDAQVDFAYVDGCHTYEAVSHDLKQLMAHSRPAVAIGGHDYNLDGVVRAVGEVLGKPDAVFPDNSWVKFLLRGGANMI
jgi:hypothetical protein